MRRFGTLHRPIRRIGTLEPGHDRDGERGQIVILFALVLVVILVFASIVVDVGVLRNNRQILVNAMDSAALAGGTLLPVNGAVPADVTAVDTLITNTVRANYPGLPSSAYTVTYRCLIGVDPASSPPQPYIARDIPAVCNPSHALGHPPVAADFHGAGDTRFSACDPHLGDRCNVVVVAGFAVTPYSFGRVVGVNSGSTGTVTSAACNGPCGKAPFTPVDVALVIDRTGSMAGDEANLRNAASAVLQAYDPNVQHVALGMLGSSSPNGTCAGSPAVHVVPVTQQTTTAPSWQADATFQTTNTATSLQIARPGAPANGDFLVAQILFNGGSGLTTITPPATGGWTLIRRTNNGANLGQALYYKWVNTSEPYTTYTWNFSSATEATGGIIRYSGVNATTPFDPNAVSGSIGTGNTGTSNSLQANGVTTGTDDTRIVTFFGLRNRASLSTPASMTEQYENQVNNTGIDLTISADDDNDTTAGGTGNKTSNAGTSSAWVAQLLTLRAIPAVQEYGTNTTTDIAKWIPVGLTGTVSSGPPPPVNERYLNTNGTLNTSSHIVKAINCFALSGTGTNLATPMDMARAYLLANGRPGVKKGIIFETDGEPNYNGWTGDTSNYTCAQAQVQADLAKAAGIEIFTIGYGVGSGSAANCPDSGGGTTVNLLSNMASGPKLGPATARCDAAENTDGDHFFCQPVGSSLSLVFQAAAEDLADLHSHLVQIYPFPVVTAISPSGGAGGTVVTVTGKYFTGATAVEFGGAAATYTVLSDTSIRATAPAGVPGRTVDITVTTPGGTTPGVAADRFTYP